jgi:AraC-like DNA-binding protein
VGASITRERIVRSTADVADQDAFGYWSDSVCRTLVGVAVSQEPGEPFNGRIEHFAAGNMGFSLLSSGAQHVERTRRFIAKGQEDYALVNIQITGEGKVAQDGRRSVLSTGAMTLIDSTRPYLMHFTGPFSQLIVKVPRPALPRRAMADATAAVLGPDGPGRIIADFFLGLERQHRRHPAAVAALIPHAIGLVDSAAGMASLTQVSEQSGAALTRERVHRFIQRYAHDPDLGASTAAAACGISRRTLFRALASGGESFTSLLRQARVALVQRTLRTAPHRPLSLVAQQAGFAGQAQMHRAFRSVTGMTPAAYRALAWGSPELMRDTGSAEPDQLRDIALPGSAISSRSGCVIWTEADGRPWASGPTQARSPRRPPSPARRRSSGRARRTRNSW